MEYYNDRGSAHTKSRTTKERAAQYSWQREDTLQRGLLIIFLFGLAAISLLSFVDAAGQFGHYVDRAFGWTVGWGRFILPFLFGILGYLFLHPNEFTLRWRHYFGIILFLFSGLALLHLTIPLEEFNTAATIGRGGGHLGLLLARPLLNFTGVLATIVILVGIFCASWLVMLNAPLRQFLYDLWIVRAWRAITQWIRARVHARRHGYVIDNGDAVTGSAMHQEDSKEEPQMSFTTKEIEHAVTEAEQTNGEQMAIPLKKRRRTGRIDIPLHLLTDRNEKPTSGDIEANKEKIQTTLENFGIDVEMGDVSVGPMVSQYTLKPAEGVKLTQITTLHNDIALALAAHPIRIEAPIPGKSLVGIEVPNKATAVVPLKEILNSKQFKQRKKDLVLCLGKHVSGQPYIDSLESMPHLLIAGATGSGKSVCINSTIVSLLYQHSPDDLRMILVDPKRVELTPYNGVPHLLTPVITDVEKTINALRWTVAEMDRRYELLSRYGKRNIRSYNDSLGNDSERLPYLVFIIDELADLMATTANSVEAAIVRLAQMSRAVGIHLILATQRPSVNVITGLIKANMPARIAFSVSSLVDSRTILDFSGAEKLLGRGDMLYINAELSKPVRLQGAYLDDGDIERVVEFLRQFGNPEYETDVVEKVMSGGARGSMGLGNNITDDAHDELLEEAKDIIVQAGKASASLLQRRLRVGYARAARILDILEEQGFIGPADGAKPREILVTKEDNQQQDSSFASFNTKSFHRESVEEFSAHEPAVDEADELDDSSEEHNDTEEERPKDRDDEQS